MKFVSDRSFADPEAAARKLLEIAHSIEAVQDGRIHIESIPAAAATLCNSAAFLRM
ncbi:hypothetical protein [Bradyrhizobium sp. STM 3562]|uniref:hypothetical protein n=1 Tax=Bradyrhizobium sp. STM 3562 TaxID=578924 RepID=UPI00388E7F62